MLESDGFQTLLLLAAQVFAVRDGATLDRPLRVAVIGGGPAGACTAETLAEGGIETYLIERKLDNCKVTDSLSRCLAKHLVCGHGVHAKSVSAAASPSLPCPHQSLHVHQLRPSRAGLRLLAART